MKKIKQDFNQLREEIINRILKGEGFSSHSQRRAAFDNADLTGPLKVLMDKVSKYSYRITDKNIDDVKATGVSENQIFELVICAAVGEAVRQNEQALKILNEIVNSQNGR